MRRTGSVNRAPTSCQSGSPNRYFDVSVVSTEQYCSIPLDFVTLSGSFLTVKRPINVRHQGGLGITRACATYRPAALEGLRSSCRTIERSISFRQLNDWPVARESNNVSQRLRQQRSTTIMTLGIG